MRFLTILFIIFLTFPSFSFAADRSDNDANYNGFEKRYDELKSEIYEMKYNLRQQIRDQQKIIKDQDDTIIDLRLKVKDLESQIFQTTQSLRNLELEVWDLKESSNKKMKTNEQ
ncbi:MAG: hypothetical protein P8X63_09500 [Desulfuromonadaceae bacterium]